MLNILLWHDSWFFISVSKLSSTGRMFQNIINNWENLDQDKNSLMFVLIAPILFLQLPWGHFNTVSLSRILAKIFQWHGDQQQQNS